jgi:hypothetical protein
MIRLIQTPPLEKKHGVVTGRIFAVLRTEVRVNALSGEVVPLGECPAWILGDAGEEVMVWSTEYEVVDDEG